MAADILRMVAAESQWKGHRYRLDDMVHREMGPGLSVISVDAHLGQVFLRRLPGGRTLLRILPGTPPEGLKDFLGTAIERFRGLGFLASRSAFASANTLTSAASQLGSADDPAAFAAIANMCRTSLIGLGNEVYRAEMLAGGDPKGDDAVCRLQAVVQFYWGAKSPRARAALSAMVKDVWDLCTATLHRRSATREEAEACLVQTAALFDSLALIVPAGT